MNYKLLAIKDEKIHEVLEDNVDESDLESVLYEYKTTIGDNIEIYYVPILDKANGR